ncbi:MAG: acetoin dehydrogenase dihydrolipoyllysine-residue acetyltransferase subunit [Pseudomonadota bacterium]|nr:acetoin dehydrogenase dihydrolipoyllysine-residue acetyltransferase subunit [Pseudomonadota bacterium]
MSEKRIVPVVMPKWGLSMKEGKVTSWLVPDGKEVEVGEPVLEVETDKIAGAVESTEQGVLRRRVGEANTTYPVKALLGVIADANVPEAEIDAYVASYVTPAADAEDEEAGPGHEFVEVSAGRLRYARRGSGPDSIVLIHGFGGDLDNWLFNIDALAPQFTVYALDLPGHGQSVKSPGDGTAAAFARTIVAFLDAQGIDRAHLVGHSLGGAIAIEVANLAPDRVRSLSLIASAGLGPEINMDYVNGFATATSRKELKPLLEKLFADPSKVSRQMIDDILKYKRLDGVSAALATVAAGAVPGGRQRSIPWPAGMRTLVIWGRHDNIVPASHAANAAGARVEIIDGAGHMVQMEDAGKVNALIREHAAG